MIADPNVLAGFMLIPLYGASKVIKIVIKNATNQAVYFESVVFVLEYNTTLIKMNDIRNSNTKAKVTKSPEGLVTI